MQVITSANNPKVKQAAKLGQSSHRRRSGQFLIEYSRDLHRALDAGFVCRRFFVDPDRFDDEILLHRLRSGGADEYVVPGHVLGKLAYREHPEGLVAVMARQLYALEQMQVRRSALLLVLSGLEKPGNIGALLRSADAAGVDGVLIESKGAGGVDVFNPNTIRASTGAVFTMPIAVAEGATLRSWLAGQQVRILAVVPDGAVAHTQANLTGAVALVLGAEAEGLAADWQESASATVRIEMSGKAADSLNVSVAGALLMFESRRQRHGV